MCTYQYYDLQSHNIGTIVGCGKISREEGGVQRLFEQALKTVSAVSDISTGIFGIFPADPGTGPA
jgi:hypothetical protein